MKKPVQMLLVILMAMLLPLSALAEDVLTVCDNEYLTMTLGELRPVADSATGLEMTVTLRSNHAARMRLQPLGAFVDATACGYYSGSDLWLEPGEELTISSASIWALDVQQLLEEQGADYIGSVTLLFRLTDESGTQLGKAVMTGRRVDMLISDVMASSQAYCRRYGDAADLMEPQLDHPGGPVWTPESGDVLLYGDEHVRLFLRSIAVSTGFDNLLEVRLLAENLHPDKAVYVAADRMYLNGCLMTPFYEGGFELAPGEQKELGFSDGLVVNSLSLPALGETHVTSFGMTFGLYAGSQALVTGVHASVAADIALETAMAGSDWFAGQYAGMDAAVPVSELTLPVLYEDGNLLVVFKGMEAITTTRTPCIRPCLYMVNLSGQELLLQLDNFAFSGHSLQPSANEAIYLAPGAAVLNSIPSLDYCIFGVEELMLTHQCSTISSVEMDLSISTPDGTFQFPTAHLSVETNDDLYLLFGDDPRFEEMYPQTW